MNFAEDVRQGLSASPKYLLSKYFYDEAGDRLFRQIMDLDEYYLTGCEFEILENNKSMMLEIFDQRGTEFQLIEFGAGDGYKTKILLCHFLQQKANFTYVPIDISRNVLEILTEDLKSNLPDLKAEALNEEYFRALKKLNLEQRGRKIVLFLGANIGNFTHPQVCDFLKKLTFNLSEGDLLMVGFDLKKDPDVLFKAYNDPKGITRDFNLNLLARINRELGGNFNLDKFQHFPRYDPVTGDMESFLLSTEKQIVRIEALDSSFSFEAWEPIHMEISKKYDLAGIESLASETGFEPVHHFFDARNYFVDTIWRVV